MTFLTDTKIAERYGVHRCTVWRWCVRKGFPSPVKIMGSARWKLADLEAWEAAR